MQRFLKKSIKINQLESVLFRPKPALTKNLSLKPFALKIRDGHLVGLAMDPQAGAPCATCVENWLIDRNVSVSRIPVEGLPPQAKKTLQKLVSDNIGHTFYEVMDNGNQNRLDCLVFPHARCRCKKADYRPPTTIRSQTNLVLSPIFQLKCVRYGTPNGNLWYFTAIGQAPLTSKIVSAHGAHPDKEQARFIALNQWLKKSCLLELPNRIEEGEVFDSNPLDENQEGEMIASKENLQLDSKVIGIGNDVKEATLDGLYQLTKKNVVEEFSRLGKMPMLIVGANHWLRQRIPFFLNQQYDLYLLFYPNQSKAWVVGIMAISRLHTEEAPHFSFGAHREIQKAMDEAIHQILKHCRPTDWKNRRRRLSKERKTKSQLGLWWNNWIYRCPKIGLKDVLQLENHTKDIKQWEAELKEQGSRVSVVPLNNGLMPANLKTLVKLNLAPQDRAYFPSHNVTGIGTWKTISDPLELS